MLTANTDKDGAHYNYARGQGNYATKEAKSREKSHADDHRPSYNKSCHLKRRREVGRLQAVVKKEKRKKTHTHTINESSIYFTGNPFNFWLSL